MASFGMGLGMGLCHSCRTSLEQFLASIKTQLQEVSRTTGPPCRFRPEGAVDHTG